MNTNTIIRVSITNDEKKTIDDLSNGVLLRILGEAMKAHQTNLMAINEDLDYYFGNKPFYNEFYKSFACFNGETIDVETIAKQNIGYAKYICDTSTSITVGRSPTIALRDPNESEKKALTKLNSMLAYRDWNKSLSDAIHSMVTCGIGYRLIHNREGDDFPRFSKLDPRTTFVIYDSSIEPESVAAVFYSKFADGNYYVYVYTDNYVYSFKTNALESVNISQSTSTPVQHYFGRVPVTEYANNEDRVGDARPAYGAIGLTCMAQNDIVKGNHDKVKTLLVLKNVTVGNDENQEAANELFKKNRMLVLDGDNAEAMYINPQIDDTSANENVKRVDNEIWMTSRIVNFNDPDFAQNSSEPALKLKMKGMIDLIQDKEKYIAPSIKREIKMIQEYLAHMKQSSAYKLDITKMYIVFNHPLPSNDLEKTTILQMMYNMDYFNPELLRGLSFMDDDLATFLSGVIKKPVIQTIKESQGNNLNNQTKQEEAKTKTGGNDNASNFAKGEANVLPK